jgi:hypothetical protein
VSSGITTKGVSFNVSDPDQRLLLEHAKKRPNFSGYVKRLIQRDMEGVGAVRSTTQDVIYEEVVKPQPVNVEDVYHEYDETEEQPITRGDVASFI